MMASNLTESFKALAQALLGVSTDIPGDKLVDVVDHIADNYSAPSDGEDGAAGATGAHVTAMELVVTEGVVTGGTATLSDETTVNITVTSGT